MSNILVQRKFNTTFTKGEITLTIISVLTNHNYTS